MYLKRQEIAGFKSFATRTKLKFEPGVVAIVGPNGSGKSNIADSVRWVLGEQSARLLRTKKGEELIFGGTESKPKASMAEVTLVLDNNDEKMPIDFREVEITRRLYRSGESDYLLNGNRVRLADIEDILARSGFGQHSYSVVGQGMIDSLILASPAERKLLFDEASGIRVFELRREASLKKLEKTKLDLLRTSDIITELEPKAKLLSDQAKLLSRRGELENNLDQARRSYLNGNLGRLEQQISQYKKEHESTATKLTDVLGQLKQIHHVQAEEKKSRAARSRQFASLTRQLKKIELSRDRQFNQLVVAQAELNLLKETQADESKDEDIKSVRSQLVAEEKSLSTLRARYDKVGTVIAALEQEIGAFDSRITALTAELNGVRSRLQKGQKKEYLQHALGLVSLLNHHRQKPYLTPDQFKLTLHKLARFIRLAADDKSDELTAQIGRLQNLITKVLSNREEVAEKLVNEILKQRSLELDINSVEAVMSSLIERRDSVLGPTAKRYTMKEDIDKRSRGIDQMQAAVERLDGEIVELRAKIYHDNEAAVASGSANLNQARAAEELGRVQARLQADVDLLKQQVKTAEQEHAKLLKQASEWFGSGFSAAGSTKVSEPTELDEIVRLEAEIELIGELDPGLTGQAVAEQTRLQFLTEQRADLTKATADLEEIITGLEGLIAEKFEQAFTKINLKFNDYFKRLFGGGSATLKLKKDNLGQYGIEIKATPPGKKVELLTSLSGGERALAAVALLTAILNVNPSPFVILDEVDAALDDANSLKFARILHELAKKTQVIVITHNHETMKIADQLFGVTTDKNSDSVIFSAKLTQARELAEHTGK